MMKWVEYPTEHELECPCCGDGVEVKTTLTDKEISRGIYQDGDEVRCIARCDAENLQISADETGVFVSGDW